MKAALTAVSVVLVVVTAALIVATLVLLGMAVFDETPVEVARSCPDCYGTESDYALLAIVTTIGALLGGIGAALSGAMAVDA